MTLVLILLVGAGVIAAFVWDFHRKAGAREAASKKRFDEIFLARPAGPPANAPLPAAPPSGASLPVVPPQAKAPAASAAPQSRDRFLGQHETLVYRLLRAGIPDHEIFANVGLASVVGGKTEQDARRVAQYCLDFVVCDKSMRVVAVVEVDAAGRAPGVGEQRFIADCLKAAGVSLVRLNPAALPRRGEIRALVCRQPDASGS